MSYIIKMALDIKAGFEPFDVQGHEVRNAGEKGYAF